MGYKPDWSAYLECECSSKEHLVVLEYDKEWGLTLNVQVRQWKGFWRRVWQAIKYVFKGETGQQFWDGMIVRTEDIPKIQEWIDKTK